MTARTMATGKAPEDSHARSSPADDAGSRPRPPSGAGRLEHLAGARCLCSTWILCDHFLDYRNGGYLLIQKKRANIAVNYFVLTSGFITHWANADRDLQCGPDLLRFYIRRIGRVVLASWISMLLFLPVQIRDEGFLWFKELGCFTFIEHWFYLPGWCPNGEIWTVASLLPCWILYPLTKNWITWIQRRGGTTALILLIVMLWAMWTVPLFIIYVCKGWTLDDEDHRRSYFWSGSMIPDFHIGVAVAGIAKQEDQTEAAAGTRECGATLSRHRMRGHMADGAVAVLVAIIFFFPAAGYPPSGDREEAWSYERLNQDVFLNHGLSLLFAVFFYGSVAGGGAGFVARLLRHKALAGLGEYSFEVYLFQELVYRYLDWLQPPIRVSVEGFMVVFVVVWLLAGLYSEFVEAPMIRWLRDISSESLSDAGKCTDR